MKEKENTKAIKIFKALENTDDALLEECANYSGAKIKIKSKWFAAAAAAVCVCAVGAGVYLATSKKDVNTYGSASKADIAASETVTAKSEESSEISYGAVSSAAEKDTANSAARSKTEEQSNINNTVFGNNDGAVMNDESKTETEICAIPHWDEMTLTEQFSEFEYNGCNYFVLSAAVNDESRIGEKLGDVTLTGYDVYTDEEYSINAEIFDMTKFSDSYMNAIKYEGYEGYYPCENSDYHPADFQQLISDTNLKEEMTYGDIWYSYFDDDMNYYDITYHVDNSDVFWTELFDKAGNPQAINAEDIPEGFFSDYDFNCESNTIRGSIGISSEGYIISNIPATGSAFYIGEDIVRSFADYIDKNFSKDVKMTPAEPFDDSEEDTQVVQTSPAYEPGDTAE